MEDLLPLLLRHGPLLVFVVTLAARVGAPLPAAPLLVVAGGLAALSQLPLVATVAVSLLANMMGDLAWFVAGRRHGYRVLGLLCRISLSPDSCVRQSENLFGRWGGLSLVAAKFVPGVSLIAAPMAGALRMRWSGFLSWNLVAAAAWTAAFMGLGALFRSEIGAALSLLAEAGAKALLVLVLVVVVFATYRWARRRRAALAAAGMLVSPRQLAAEMSRGTRPVMLDVRGPGSRAAAPPIEGSLFAELGRVEQAVQGMPRNTDVVTYCNCPNDASAVMAAQALHALGFAGARVLAGGLDAWNAHALKAQGDSDEPRGGVPADARAPV